MSRNIAGSVNNQKKENPAKPQRLLDFKSPGGAIPPSNSERKENGIFMARATLIHKEYRKEHFAKKFSFIGGPDVIDMEHMEDLIVVKL